MSDGTVMADGSFFSEGCMRLGGNRRKYVLNIYNIIYIIYYIYYINYIKVVREGMHGVAKIKLSSVICNTWCLFLRDMTQKNVSEPSEEFLRAAERISSGGCASGGAPLHFLTKSWAFFAWNERGFLVPL